MTMKQTRNIHRAQRVGEMLQQALGMYFIEGGSKDPRLENKNITVTYVRLSDDLKFAKVYIQVLGQTQVEKDVLEALNEDSYRIKRDIAHALKLRYTPAMTFLEDVEFEKGQKLYQMIESLHKGEGQHD